MNPALSSVSLARLRSALEASWAPDTAYLGVHRPGNPALGQCYPTARVVQWFFPHFEIASGQVNTGSSIEAHFWNVDPAQRPARHVDMTWRQFPAGAEVASFAILDRDVLNDSPPTVARCELLLRRVLSRIGVADAVRDRPRAARQWLGGCCPVEGERLLAAKGGVEVTAAAASLSTTDGQIESARQPNMFDRPARGARSSI